MKVKTGVAFPDFISSEKPRRGGHYNQKQYQMRGFFIPIILFLAIIQPDFSDGVFYSSLWRSGGLLGLSEELSF